MTPIKRILFILAVFALTLSSCTSTKFSTNRSFQKRKYTKGVFIKKHPNYLSSNSSERTQEKNAKQLDLETEDKINPVIAIVEETNPTPSEKPELEQEQAATSSVNLSETHSQDYSVTDLADFNETQTAEDQEELVPPSIETAKLEETKSSTSSHGMSRSKKHFILFLVFLALCILILLLASLDSIGWGAALLLGVAFFVFALLAIISGIKAMVFAGS